MSAFTCHVLTLSVLAASPPAATLPVLPLDGAIEEAKRNNLDLKAAQARLAQAWLATRKAWSSYLPRLATSASYTRNSVDARIQVPNEYYIRSRTVGFGMPDPAPDPAFDPSGPPSTSNPPGAQTSYFLYPRSYLEMILQRRDQVSAQVELSQALVAPALWSLIGNAYVTEEIASLNMQTTRREVLFMTTQLYYGAVGLKQTVQAQERILEVSRRHELDAKVRLASGTSSEAVLLRAQIERVKAERDLRSAQSAYRSAKIELSTLLGRDDQFEVDIPPEPRLPPDVATLGDSARDRTDVVAARLEMKLAEGQLTSARYRYLPSLGLTAGYRVANVAGFTGQYDSWAITLGLTWVAYDGGSREAEVCEWQARVTETRAQSQLAERRARDQVARDWLELERFRANRATAEEQLRLARRNSETLNEAFRSGAATSLDVEDANASLQGAEVGVISETLNANLAALRLLRSAGAFEP